MKIELNEEAMVAVFLIAFATMMIVAIIVIGK